MIKMEDWLIQSFGFSHSSKVSCQKGAVGDNSYTWWDFLLLFRHSTGPSLQMLLGTDLAGTPVPCVPKLLRVEVSRSSRPLPTWSSLHASAGLECLQTVSLWPRALVFGVRSQVTGSYLRHTGKHTCGLCPGQCWECGQDVRQVYQAPGKAVKDSGVGTSLSNRW